MYQEKLMRWSYNEACLVSRKLTRPQTWSRANSCCLMLFGLPVLLVSRLFICCLLNSFPVPQSSCCRFSLLSTSNIIMSPPWAQVSSSVHPGSSYMVLLLSLGISAALPTAHLTLLFISFLSQGKMDILIPMTKSSLCFHNSYFFFNTFHKTVQCSSALWHLFKPISHCLFEAVSCNLGWFPTHYVSCGVFPSCSR